MNLPNKAITIYWYICSTEIRRN